jgi:hypothetical protein
MVPTLPLQTGGPGPAVSVAFVLVGVGVLAVFARRSVGRLFTMLRTETRSVAGVEPGLVEVEGEVVPAGETVTGRTFETQTDEAVVTQYRRSGGPNDDGRDFTLPVPQQFAPELLNEETVVPFYVEDDTGRVLVDPAYADISLDSDHSRHDNLSDQTTVEAVLQPGEHVYVLGHAVPAGEYPQRATHRGGVVRSILRFFRGGAGRTTAEKALDGEDLVITRTSPAAEFFISDTSERRGMLRLGLMAAFWTLSGLVAVGAGVYLLVDGLVGL